MKKLLKFSVFAAVMAIMSCFVFAAPFDATVTPIKDKIVVDEVAEFNITIENNLDRAQEFTIKKAGYPFWDMYTQPLQNPITLKVAANSAASISVFVDPLYITSVDTYTLDPSIVMESTGEEQKVAITVGIKSTDPLIGGYIPTVLANIDIPEKIDPRDEFTIKVLLNNQNSLDYPNLTIKAESKLFKDELNYLLGPKEDRVVEIKKKLDAMTAPQKDDLVVAVFRGDRMIVSPIVKEFEITEYVVTEPMTTETSFMKTRKGISLYSNSPDYSGDVKIETTSLKNLFTSTNPRAKFVKENGKEYLVWNVHVDSDRKASVYMTENYRPIPVIAIAAIIAIVLYFLFRSPIVVRKSIANVGMSEGGISEAKVVVRVKNRSSHQITAIEVMDNAPHIAHVEKELSIGSMQPNAILKHPKGGIVIKWNVESLDTGEERVLSYKMKSRLAILGELSLPAASARCKVGNRVIITQSNRASTGN
ncbi:MAG: hypothetical protein AABX00_00405 [Nanoarchaeota archaeon]